MGEGRVEYVPICVLSIGSPGPSNLRISSGKFKKRKISRSPVKRRFEIASPPQSSQQHRVVENLGSTAAWTATNPAENHGAVGQTGEPLPFSKVDCRN